MKCPKNTLGIQKFFLGIFYEVVFSFAWTKLNLKSFLLLWFWMTLLGTTTRLESWPKVKRKNSLRVL